MELEGFSRHAGSFSAADAGTGRICAEQGSLCYGEPSARGQAYPHWCFYRGMNVAQATSRGLTACSDHGQGALRLETMPRSFRLVGIQDRPKLRAGMQDAATVHW